MILDTVNEILTAGEDVWEGYLTQKYRFTFSLSKENILFRNIGPHGIIDKGKV